MKYSIFALCLLLLLALTSCIRIENGGEDPDTDTWEMPEGESSSDREPTTETEPDTGIEEDTLPNEADPDHTKRY